MPLLRFTYVVLAWFSLELSAWAQPQLIHPGLTGTQLADALRSSHSPTINLGYTPARKELFTKVEKSNGQTRLIYTPEFIVTSSIPQASVANTEHVWPQSKFKQSSKKDQIKADVHHLFPCRDEVNTARDNNPFADIPDDQTKKWWASSNHQTATPAVGDTRDQFSESTNDRFEPREAHKGDVARAMFYVLVIYGNTNLDMGWFNPQLETLLKWHEADPADDLESERTARAKQVQGNENPFILDRTLIYRFLNRPVPNPGPNPTPFAVAPSKSPAVASKTLANDKVKIVTWNMRQITSGAEISNRAPELKAFADAMKPDILLLQEVTSIAEVRLLRDAMGLNTFHVACSNFEEDDNSPGSFEVAIVSRFPLDNVVEFDPTPDNDPEDPDSPETEHKLIVPELEGLRTNIATSRGFLRARIDALKLVVRVAHLKSSVGQNGPADRRNAEKRELVAAAIALDVSNDKNAYPGYSSVVAGDFNVGATDATKNGDVLTSDFASDANPDGYDETHSLLTKGLVNSLKMKNLAASLNLPSFVSGNPAHGPIDWILVEGNKSGFSNAVRAPLRFGSDHWAIATEYQRP